MSTERHLLFGLLARHAGMMDGPALIEAIGLWNMYPARGLADLLKEYGWVVSAQREQVETLLDRFMQDHAGNVAAALSAAIDGPQPLIPKEEVDLRHAVLTALDANAVHEAATMDDGGAGASLPYLVKTVLPSGPRYARTSLHASGGMGSVWLARDANIGRDVALKELRAERAANSAVPLRFLREARITGQLEHPGIVPVYEIGRDPATGHPFYTMRFVRGRTLTEAALAFHEHRRAGRDDPLDFVNLLSAFVSVCHTIAYAHSHGVVHRDLKGENIILGDFGEVIVLDWGLAKRLERHDEQELPSEPLGAETELSSAAGQTLMGQVIGTPAYMAPEQARGRPDLVGPRTDIFGTGAILYEILAGRPPFGGGNVAEVLRRARLGEITPPHTWWPDVPPALEAACLKALSKEPAHRYSSATELAREVQGWQDRQRRRAEDELRAAGQRLMQQQAALMRLTRSEVFAAPELSQILHRMVEVSARTLSVERVSVWRYTEDRRAIRSHLLYELSADRTSAGLELKADAFPSYFEALNTSDVIAAHDAHNDPRTCEFSQTYLTPLNIGAIMDAPIHISGEMQGVVCHEHVGGPRKWMPDEQVFAVAIANLVSHAISLWEQQQRPAPPGPRTAAQRQRRERHR